MTNPELVAKDDVMDRIHRLVAVAREHNKKELSHEFFDGYEEGLHDLADALGGWCGSHFAIPSADATPEAEAS